MNDIGRSSKRRRKVNYDLNDANNTAFTIKTMTYSLQYFCIFFHFCGWIMQKRVTTYEEKGYCLNKWRFYLHHTFLLLGYFWRAFCSKRMLGFWHLSYTLLFIDFRLRISNLARISTEIPHSTQTENTRWDLAILSSNGVFVIVCTELFEITIYSFK